MSILSHCPGGTLLEPPREKVADTDLIPFADELIAGLCDGSIDPLRADFLCLDVVRYRGKLYSLRNRRL